jgi:hypothetical protein
MANKKQTISEIAAVIREDWKKVNYGAEPYLRAMSSMETIDDSYGMESGRFIVAYFLSNASAWRGDVARETKKELNKRIKY